MQRVHLHAGPSRIANKASKQHQKALLQQDQGNHLPPAKAQLSGPPQELRRELLILLAAVAGLTMVFSCCYTSPLAELWFQVAQLSTRMDKPEPGYLNNNLPLRVSQQSRILADGFSLQTFRPGA
eukprot:1159118-Pelagomonas_calceolata.AAC.8